MSERKKPTAWFSMTRRKMLGGILVGAGWLLTGVRMPALGQPMTEKGNVLLDRTPNYPPGLEDAVKFTLMDALYGRRSRRFMVGAEIPDGVLAFKSKKQPHPLDSLEQVLVLTAAAGNTGWHNMIYRDSSYAPHLSDYSAAGGGRTFPSPAGWHVVDFFYTDDNGVYYFPTRDAPSLMERNEKGQMDLNAWIEAHRARIKKLAAGRLHLPATEPYIEGHNTWCANRPGSTLIGLTRGVRAKWRAACSRRRRGCHPQPSRRIYIERRTASSDPSASQRREDSEIREDRSGC